MDPLTTKRTKATKIPVLVRNYKSSNLTSKENEFNGKQTLFQSSSINKPAPNSHCLQKQLVNKSKSQVDKITSDKTYKSSKNSSSVSQTSNSNRTAAKSSDFKLKEQGKKSSSQLEGAHAVKSCTKKIISKNTSSISQTSSNKTAAENFQKMKINPIKKTSYHANKPLNDKNIKKLKDKFAVSKVNTHTTEKVNVNSKPIKNMKSVTPKTTPEKENQESSDTNCFSAQKDIKFEANEFCRNLILSGRELSPSLCKTMPGFRLSSVQAQRPSAYQKFEVHPNPYKDALQAIAEASAKRASRYVSMQKDKKIAPQQVLQERSSFYTPCANPKEEVMRSLEAFKARRMQKSALKSSKKKVTFNLNVEEYTAKLDCGPEPVPSKSSETTLMQINERSEENTPSSPVKNEPEIVNLESSKNPSEYQELCVQMKAAILTEESIHSPIKETGVSPIVSPFCSIKKINHVASPPESTYSDIKFTQKTLNSQSTTGILFERNTNEQRIKKMSHAKLCTPRPISFFSNSIFVKGSPSPELARKTFSPSLAPIYTPLALKSMAKSSVVSPDAALSPICLKLDFTATENDTPIKENSVKHALGSFKQIVTVQRKLDNLADQECSFWLPNEGVPVVCGRHLQNPVAITLTEGDEMHFLPIRL